MTFCDGRQVGTRKVVVDDRQPISIDVASIGRWTKRNGGRPRSRSRAADANPAVFARSLPTKFIGCLKQEEARIRRAAKESVPVGYPRPPSERVAETGRAIEFPQDLPLAGDPEVVVIHTFSIDATCRLRGIKGFTSWSC